jgi:hypothetical protein
MAQCAADDTYGPAPGEGGRDRIRGNAASPSLISGRSRRFPPILVAAGPRTVETLRATGPRFWPDRFARLRLMRAVSGFREAMWGVLQQAISALGVDFGAYADRHLTRLLANATGDAHEEALALVRDGGADAAP